MFSDHQEPQLLALDWSFSERLRAHDHTPKDRIQQHLHVTTATERAGLIQNNLGAPALRHDVIASNQGVAPLFTLCFRGFFMSRET